jgi:hypothetical protein
MWLRHGPRRARFYYLYVVALVIKPFANMNGEYRRFEAPDLLS